MLAICPMLFVIVNVQDLAVSSVPPVVKPTAPHVRAVSQVTGGLAGVLT